MAGRRILQDFILPALEDQRFGHRMTWVNEERNIFRVFWTHKRSSEWDEKDFAVFLAWDEIKGRQTENDTYAASKQRFRAAMRKHSCVKSLRSPEKKYKYFQLDRRSENLPPSISRSRAIMQKNAQQRIYERRELEAAQALIGLSASVQEK